MSIFRVLLGILFLSFCSHASAQTSITYWWAESNDKTRKSGHTAEANAACAQIVPAGYTAAGSGGYSGTSCYGYLGGNIERRYVIGIVYRKTELCSSGNTGLYCNAENGKSCERDGTPNTGFGFITNAAGECVDWTRADLPSQCKSLGGTGTPIVRRLFTDDNGDPMLPPSLSVSGCAVTPAPVIGSSCTSTHQTTWPTGGGFQSNYKRCSIYVSFTGAVSDDSGGVPPIVTDSGNSGLCDPLADCGDIPEPPTTNNQQPCTYVLDGEGRRVCSSQNYNYVPGKTSCGTVNGQFQCIGKAPSTNGITIGTTVTDKQNPDGTTTSTKTDTIEQITCVGANACTSTTTKNSTVVIKDGAGNTVSQSGSCTGPLCAPDGKGDKDGDGVKDCIGPRCAEDGEEGEDEEFGGPENEEVGGFGETTSAFMSRLNGAPVVAAAKNLSFGGGGSCQFGSFTVPILGTLSFQPVCAWAAEWLAPLRALMLAVWALMAVRVFLEA